MKCEAIFPFFAVLLAVGLGQMTGGRQDADASEPMAKEALNFAVREHNAARNDMYLSQVAKVLGVQKQIVAGVKYYFTVKMEKPDQVPVQTYQCVFIVVSRPWENYLNVQSEKCT